MFKAHKVMVDRYPGKRTLLDVHFQHTVNRRAIWTLTNHAGIAIKAIKA